MKCFLCLQLEYTRWTVAQRMNTDDCTHWIHTNRQFRVTNEPNMCVLGLWENKTEQPVTNPGMWLSFSVKYHVVALKVKLFFQSYLNTHFVFCLTFKMFFKKNVPVVFHYNNVKFKVLAILCTQTVLNYMNDDVFLLRLWIRIGSRMMAAWRNLCHYS